MLLPWCRNTTVQPVIRGASDAFGLNNSNMDDGCSFKEKTSRPVEDECHTKSMGLWAATPGCSIHNRIMVRAICPATSRGIAMLRKYRQVRQSWNSEGVSANENMVSSSSADKRQEDMVLYWQETKERENEALVFYIFWMEYYRDGSGKESLSITKRSGCGPWHHLPFRKNLILMILQKSWVVESCVRVRYKMLVAQEFLPTLKSPQRSSLATRAFRNQRWTEPWVMVIRLTEGRRIIISHCCYLFLFYYQDLPNSRKRCSAP